MLTPAKQSSSAPFDTERLDRLMEERGIDVVIASSKHNVQYLLGGHRSLFFDYMDATALTRYLPVFVYAKGRVDKAAYFGHRLEGFQHQVKPFWTPEAQTSSNGSVDAVRQAADYIRRAGYATGRIAVELGFMPMDAGTELRKSFPDADIVDAVFVLERLRAIKSAAELDQLRIASDLVIDSMLAVIANHGPGTTKNEINEALRREEANRGLIFEYCLMTAGASHNRAPSDQSWEEGDVLSLDSGGNYHGYIGDVCRMAVLGEPDAELVDLLAEVETIQQAGIRAVQPGALGRATYDAAEAVLQRSRHHNHMEFLAHGMGLVSHEAPRLTSTGPVPYPADDADKPLQPGMLVSVETTLKHPTRGFIKLEDTVAVTATGHEVFGDRARGWNIGGTALSS
jgi:Xaa-Pro aminopeptidase